MHPLCACAHTHARPDRSAAPQISQSHSTLMSYGVEMGGVGYWVENHDTDRFLSTRASLPAYRNALAFIVLAEGIPIM